MLNNSYAKDDYRLKKIVSKAVATSVELRTKSILELKKQLMGLQGSDEYENIRERRLEKKIAVVGEGNSVGVTHIAIALCQYLNGMKLDAYYRDKEKNTVNELWKNLRGFRLKEGVLYHESFKGLMNYGKAVKQYKPPIGIEIIDCGANIKDLYYDADIILYITSGTPWKKKIMYPHWIKDENVYIINNFAGRISTIKLAKELKKKVYLYPVVRRSLRLSKDEEKVFNAIIKNEKDLQFKKGKK